MHTSSRSIAFLTAAVLLLAGCQSTSGPSQQASSSSSAHPMIEVTAPTANATVASPLTVTGRARGPWYFEASFPVKLLDSNGNELAFVPAQAQGEWQTEDFVPFQATLTFTTNDQTGTLVLMKDNPSGLSENDDAISIPVQF